MCRLGQQPVVTQLHAHVPRGLAVVRLDNNGVEQALSAHGGDEGRVNRLQLLAEQLADAGAAQKGE